MASALLLWQCEITVDEFQPSNGSADFSSFVVVGDSYAAGYTDGALSDYGQTSSYAYILAKQLQTAGAGEFKQPMVPAGNSVGSAGNGNYELQIVGGNLMPVPTTGNPELLTNPANWINGQAPFHNVGVPGAKSFHAVTPLFGDPAQGENGFNPFYARFASNPGASTMVSDGLLNDPTFFVYWMAGNDVLGYALAGGEGDVGGVKQEDITVQYMFDFGVDKALSDLTQNGTAKGVIGNIPSIDALPFFTYIYQTMGFMPLLVEDETAELGFRPMVEGELILLNGQGELMAGAGQSPQFPLKKEFVLDLEEINNIKTATAGFNAFLKEMAEDYELAFMDADQLMDDILKNGVLVDGHTYSADFISGGIMSLDGIHVTGKGSAIIANAFIKKINEKYGSTVPYANINDYSAVAFP
jgi:hypothetical protein